MINPHDALRYTNVLSSRYSFHYLDMSHVMQHFLEEAVQVATWKGPFFYALHNVPRDEVIHAEFFLPVVEDNPSITNDMRFHSYFSVESLMSLTIFDSYELQTEIAYRLLIEYMEEQSLRQCTPFFHVLEGVGEQLLVSIKVGGYPFKPEELWR